MNLTPAMSLPPPSPIDAFVLENPWPLVIVLIIVANLIWIIWRYRSTRRALIGAMACLGLAILAGLLGQLIDTPGEIVRAKTRQFVKSVVLDDATLAQSMIADSARLQIDGEDYGLDADRIRALLPQGREVIRANAIQAINGQGTRKDTAASTLEQRTTSPLGLAIPNQWRLTWKRQPDLQWRIVTINWLTWDDNPPPANLLR